MKRGRWNRFLKQIFINVHVVGGKVLVAKTPCVVLLMAI
jgi:hypothetical protein